MTDILAPAGGDAATAADTALNLHRIAPATPLGWREALVGSARLVRDRPALIAVGLLGFLARGGLVAFLLPIVALPTPVGISTFIGGTALTGAGASDGLIRMIVLGVALVVTAVVGGAVLGAVADVLLGREAVAFALARERGIVTEHGREVVAREARAAVPASFSLVGRVFVIRALALIPVAIAVAWATSRLVAAGYHQLILPDDLTVPLGLRILIEALGAAAVCGVVWLVSEFLGGIAVRHVVIGGRGVASALVSGLVGVVRRPLTSLATNGLGVLGLALAAGPALLIAALLWSRLQSLLADDVPVLLLLPATFVFVMVWVGGLVAVGAVAAWRSVLGSMDVLRARGARSAEAHGPIGRAAETSAMVAMSRGRTFEER